MAKSGCTHGMLHLVHGVNSSKMDLNADASTLHFQLAFVIKDQKAVQHFCYVWNHSLLGVVMLINVVSAPCDTSPWHTSVKFGVM